MHGDELYGVALEQFIPERGALVKALRAEKRRDDAAAVAALRKPSVAAWAVNQLVRSQPSGVQELYAAGDALRDAQARLLAGTGDGRALRAANERERAAVDALVQAARGLLSSDGHELSPAVVERVADTLHAAALDEAAREQVREGRLARELRHVGLGLGESADPFAVAPPAPRQPAAKPAAGKAKAKAKAPGPAAVSAPARRAAPVAKPSAEARRAAREQAKRERGERELRERERAEARKAARIAEAAAKRRVERAGHALKAAEERRERAAKALEQADDALVAAQAEVDEAAAAHEQARAELDAA
ncbi:MAG: hypothetical protein Q8K79_17670 [Solirubrobacteraceae bacterium]|nr:hypothetical protein [Solirubrobacteraceae bacterium]